MKNIEITTEIAAKLDFMAKYTEKNNNEGFKTLEECVALSNKFQSHLEELRVVVKANSSLTDNYDVDYIIHCMFKGWEYDLSTYKLARG